MGNAGIYSNLTIGIPPFSSDYFSTSPITTNKQSAMAAAANAATMLATRTATHANTRRDHASKAAERFCTPRANQFDLRSIRHRRSGSDLLKGSHRRSNSDLLQGGMISQMRSHHRCSSSDLSQVESPVRHGTDTRRTPMSNRTPPLSSRKDAGWEPSLGFFDFAEKDLDLSSLNGMLHSPFSQRGSARDLFSDRSGGTSPYDFFAGRRESFGSRSELFATQSSGSRSDLFATQSKGSRSDLFATQSKGSRSNIFAGHRTDRSFPPGSDRILGVENVHRCLPDSDVGNLESDLGRMVANLD